MNENEVVNNEVTEEMVEILPDQPEEKKGLTGTQKAIGIGILGAALYGVTELVIRAVKGIKKLIGKLKAKKAEKDAKDDVIDDVIEVDMTAEEIEKASEEK